jgi:hypothetical protein
MVHTGEGGMRPETISAARANDQVVSAIKDYCRFKHAQGFAVMVDGKWGSGKTHLIKSVMGNLIEQSTTQRNLKPLYISLYGVKSADEISDLIYQQLHPVLSSKPIRMGGVILKALAKGALKIDIEGLPKDSLTLTPALSDLGAFDLVSGNPRSILVFDDFERACMPVSEILGFINPFVEHDRCKVIILSNESEILDQPNYLLRKEKTVGQTYEVVPDIDSAFKDFTQQIDTDCARDFLSQQKSFLFSIFRDSESGNLRSLKQSLWEFERLWLTLKPNQRSNEKAMRELLGLMCAISFEMRSNRIKNWPIRLRDLSYFMRLQSDKADPETTANTAMYNRYPTVEWSSTLLNTETIRIIIEKGRIDSAEIQRQFSQHPYFMPAQELPSWTAVWRSYEFSEEAQKEALGRFTYDFESRTFRSFGMLLHVIGLSLWLAKIGQPGWPNNTIIDRLKAYADEIYDGDDATIDDLESLESSRDEAYGFGFKASDDPNFKELKDYAILKDGAWRNRALPLVAARLIELMTTDSDTFLREICYTNGGSSRFANLPVLHTISPHRFAEIFSDTNYYNQKNIIIGLSIRFDQASPGQVLNVEIPWAKNVFDELLSRCSSMSPINRDQVSSLVKHYLGNALRKISRSERGADAKADDLSA